MTTNAQILVVTGQPLPNLLPILQFNPEYAVLLVSEKMQGPAEAFKKLLRRLRPALKVSEHNGLPDSDTQQIQAWAMDALEALRGDLSTDTALSLNLTGGTKLIVLALYEIWREDMGRIIYVNTDHNCIESIYPVAAPQDMQSQLDIETYLAAMGKTLRKVASNDPEWHSLVEARKNVTQELVKESKQIDPIFSILNKAAHNAIDDNKLVQPRQSLPSFKRLNTFLHCCAEADLIDFDEVKSTLYFRTLGEARYLGGGWLEEYCWRVANHLNFDYVGCGVAFTDDLAPKKDVRNEIDLIIVHRNRMLAVECKSGRIDVDGSDADIIYKLDSIAAHAGGLLCSRLLVAAQSLDHVTAKGKSVSPTARAQANDIHTCAGPDLKNLETMLTHWRDHGRLP